MRLLSADSAGEPAEKIANSGDCSTAAVWCVRSTRCGDSDRVYGETDLSASGGTQLFLNRRPVRDPHGPRKLRVPDKRTLRIGAPSVKFAPTASTGKGIPRGRSRPIALNSAKIATAQRPASSTNAPRRAERATLRPASPTQRSARRRETGHQIPIATASAGPRGFLP